MRSKSGPFPAWKPGTIELPHTPNTTASKCPTNVHLRGVVRTKRAHVIFFVSTDLQVRRVSQFGQILCPLVPLLDPGDWPMIRQSIKKRDRLMNKIISLAAMVTLMALASSVADARGPGGAISAASPGQTFIAAGKTGTGGTPGASGYSPGQRYLDANKTTTPPGPGASVYAPGFLK